MSVSQKIYRCLISRQCSRARSSLDDSGISHLAAAAGANCILLFGPTNPDVWAPKNKNVRVLCAQSGRLSHLEIGSVQAAITAVIYGS
ncbi:MAG: hypothetical protein DMF39_11530 [Verrucomicrobia bacterium]|nr:MAG: hypothetical protein DMF39_11530 [Verrucomicrobiota bacterium]